MFFRTPSDQTMFRRFELQRLVAAGRKRIWPAVWARCLYAVCATVCLLKPSLTFADEPGPQDSRPNTIHSEENRQLTKPMAVVEDDRIQEASGLCASILHPECFWTHNDSGDTARLFLVGFDGVTRAVVRLRGVTAFDWEDMCSFRLHGEAWLLIADVGDNAGKRSLQPGGNPACRLLLVREPSPDQVTAGGGKTISVLPQSIIEFRYEDGPRDCESVAVDTENRQILLVSKSLPTSCAMYQLPLLTERGNHSAVASRIASPGIPFATAMDISPENDRMVIVTMWSGVVIERQPGEDWKTAASGSTEIRHLTLPPRKQGETVCFTPGGDALLLTSEGVRQPVWRLPVPQPEKKP